MITLGCAAATDTGRLREINEDSILSTPPIFAVADGLGGYRAGQVASGIVVTELARLTRTQSSTRPEEVTAALQRANDAILTAAAGSVDMAGMGTTASGIAMVNTGGVEHWMVFNVGDSRVYRLSDGRLTQLTVDHSEVQELVAAGSLTRAMARDHPRRNVVTRALGSDPPPVIDSWLLPVVVGERLLICSDGLVNELDDGDLLSVLRVGGPEVVAPALVEAARTAGGRDNISAVVVEVAVMSADVDEDTTPRGGPGDAP
jgi:PPM family protein phosphatase